MAAALIIGIARREGAKKSIGMLPTSSGPTTGAIATGGANANSFSSRSSTATDAPHLLHEVLCDAHDPNAVAVRYQDQDLLAGITTTHHDNDLDLAATRAAMRELTYGQMRDRSMRLARTLRDEAGVGRGDVVAVMLPKGPRVAEVAVALSRLGAVYQPLFTAFERDGIAARVVPSEAKAFVTDGGNRVKLEGLVDKSKRVICVGETLDGGMDQTKFEGDLDYEEVATCGAPLSEEDHGEAPSLLGEPSHPLSLLFSSGTTGPPKGIVCPVRALENFRVYLEQGLGLRPNDADNCRYWNVADSGWAYGLYYNVYGPLYTGQTSHVLADGRPFSALSALRFIAANRITDLTAAPTLYRSLRSAPLDDFFCDLVERTELKAASSAGEPLAAPVCDWFRDTFGVPIRNHYGQTENGMMINQHHAGPLSCRGGGGGGGGSIIDEEGSDSTSMGVPMEGFEGACLLDDDGNVIDDDGDQSSTAAEGELCMKVSDCPLFWFSGYFRRGDLSPVDSKGYYHTGDRATMKTNADGKKTFFFSGRDDDIINMAGYRCGPAEIENSIMQLDSVSEVGVIGVPDELKGSVVKAYVVLKDDDARDTFNSEKMKVEIKNHVRKNLARHLVPKIIVFVPHLPKTESGKVKRFVLRRGFR